MVAPALPLAAQANDEQCFQETGHCIRGAFLAYWRANGGLRQQGLPISAEFDEQQPPPPVSHGEVRKVQYFERARFEHHPQFAGTENEVLLGRIGAEQYQARYAGQSPAAPPTASGRPQLEFLSDRVYRQYSNLIIVGELRNSGGDASDIQVAASVIGANGATIATGTDQLSLLILGNGKSTGYRISISNAPAQYAQIKLQAQADSASDVDRRFYYGNLVVEGVTVQPAANDFSGATVTGQIRNNGAVASSGRVIAMAVGPDDKVLDVDEGYAGLDTIPPGGTAPFKVTWQNQRTLPATVRFTVYGTPK
jgi:hypothetical protein